MQPLLDVVTDIGADPRLGPELVDEHPELLPILRCCIGLRDEGLAPEVSWSKKVAVGQWMAMWYRDHPRAGFERDYVQIALVQWLVDEFHVGDAFTQR